MDESFDFGFPATRLRRLRYHPIVRRMAQTVSVDPGKMILPLFVRPGREERIPIASMPGNFQLSIDELVKELIEVRSLGIGGVMLFGIPECKDAVGSDAMSDDGIIATAIRAASRFGK